MKQRLNFDLMVTEGAERWRTFSRSIDAGEKFVAAAANDPAALVSLAQTAFVFLRAKQLKLQSYLRERFGIEVDDPLGDEASQLRIRVVDEECARGRFKTLEDVAEETDVVISLVMYNTAWWAM